MPKHASQAVTLQAIPLSTGPPFYRLTFPTYALLCACPPLHRSSSVHVLPYTGPPLCMSSSTQVLLCARPSLYRSSTKRVLLFIYGSSPVQVLLYAGSPLHSYRGPSLYVGSPLNRTFSIQVLYCTGPSLCRSSPVHVLLYMQVLLCTRPSLYWSSNVQVLLMYRSFSIQVR